MYHRDEEWKKLKYIIISSGWNGKTRYRTLDFLERIRRLFIVCGASIWFAGKTEGKVRRSWINAKVSLTLCTEVHKIQSQHNRSFYQTNRQFYFAFSLDYFSHCLRSERVFNSTISFHRSSISGCEMIIYWFSIGQNPGNHFTLIAGLSIAIESRSNALRVQIKIHSKLKGLLSILFSW